MCRDFRAPNGRLVGNPKSYPSRQRAARKWRYAALAGMIGAMTGCASAPSAPPPPAPAPENPVVERTELESAIAALDGFELPEVAPTLPLLPYVAPLVTWTPLAPREGDAVGFYLSTHAPGANLSHLPAARGELNGLPVGFAEAGEGWFGIAAAPVGEAGVTELVIRYATDGGAVSDTSGEGAWETLTTIPFEIRRRDFPARELSVASRYSNPSAEALKRIEREREEIRATLAVTTPRSYLDGDFRWPRRGRVTAGFGQRRVFNGELQSRHWGLDVSGRTGEPVRSTARGRVALTGEFYFAGGAVFIDHGLGVYTAYFHLSRIHVAPGDFVERGQLVGDVGATGRVTAAHLHWSLYVAGQSLDASSLLEIEVPEPRRVSPED